MFGEGVKLLFDFLVNSFKRKLSTALVVRLIRGKGHHVLAR